jgi:ribosomal protein L44E
MEQEKKVYCLKCKQHTENKDPSIVTINDKPSLRATCGTCGKAKHVFVKKSYSLPEKTQ